MSHALFDAYDRMDEKAFVGMLGPTFSLFEEQQEYGESTLLKGMRERLARHAPARSRTWSVEHVSVGPNAAVFVGEATEHMPPGEGPSGEFVGWSTIVWVREVAGWRAAHWQWQMGGVDAARQMWNDTYRAGAGRAFTVAPNQLLVASVKGLAPGAALDVGMGQGRNAVYLASQGWKVTGIDISTEGLRMARDEAARRGLSIDAIDADLASWDYGVARWDLIAMIYVFDDGEVLARIKASLKKGGMIVVEGFHKDGTKDPDATSFETNQLASLFKDGYEILRDEVVEDVADWGNHRTKLVRFVARKR